MDKQLFGIAPSHRRKLLKILGIIAIGLFVVLHAASVGDHTLDSELNEQLVAAVKEEPALFGTDALCERDAAFWNAVEKSSLLAVLERQQGFEEITLDADYTVWFVPVSPCFGGNQPGFIMLARIDDQLHSITTPISGHIENVRLEDNKIVFLARIQTGFASEYFYHYTYDGKELRQELLERAYQ